MKKRIWAALLLAVLLALPAAAPGQEMDAQQATAWLEQFAGALAALPVLNDPGQTADPSRPGEYLLEYEFGTVLARAAQSPSAADILEVDVCTAQVTDCRGMRVGMTMQQVLEGAQVPQSDAQLVVLGTQEAGFGWSWAYVGAGGVYGLEWLTYDMTDAAAVREYTLTYVIAEDGAVSAIRLKTADSTQAQAQAGLRTAQELAGRQQRVALAAKNAQAMFGESDLQVMAHRALGVPVYELVALLGEPVEVQTLPAGGGRILLYEGAAVQLGLDERTGEEIVLGITAGGTGIIGPRGLSTGMSVQEAASLFRCDADVYAQGGALYVEGEALGEAPYGEMTATQGGESALRYACATAEGRIARLDIGLRDGGVAYWRLFYEEGEAQDDRG